MTLGPNSPCVGKRVDEVSLPSDTALVAILRGPSVITPSADDRFEIDDELLFVAAPDQEAKLESILGSN
jgi:trk system potassium uptake protein TrkA